jgi:hypothetical protein
MVTRFRSGLLLAMMAGLTGCTSPPATLELVGVAQKALADARTYQAQRHQEAMGNLVSLASSLDAAFDADVRLAAAGGIVSPDGKSVALSPEWVISARKGYAAGRDALASQRQKMDSGHAQQLDNLSAASEALDLAKALIIQSSFLNEQARQILMSLQRKAIP